MILANSPLSDESIEGISRQSSISLKGSNGKRKAGIDNVLVCKEVPTKHFHVASMFGHQELPQDIINWTKEIELQYPAILFSNQEFCNSKTQQANLWEAKQYKVGQSGKIFVRVFESKIYSETEKHYQLTLKVGRNTCKSCLSSKIGNIEDWFMIDLDESIDFSTTCLEVIIDTIPEQQYKQKKNSILKVKASEFISAISRSSSVRGSPFGSSGLPQTGLLRIPLGVLCGNKNLEFGGRFTVKSFSNLNLGEVTLHIIPTNGSILKVESCDDQLSKDRKVLHQGYINVEADGEWQRYWALLTQDRILLRDIKHRTIEAGPNTFISLSDIIKIDLVHGEAYNAIGLKNSLELGFEDDGQIFMYMDDEFEAKNWADALSRTIWGQPYTTNN